jgi:hypothetical protein
MSLTDSKATLSRAAKDLFARWDEVKEVWGDEQSREFEKDFLSMFEQDVRSALTAMDHMDFVIQRIKQECE